jgi:prepilin-type N-terminal cleavage/methylation domain-containing protein/prepilin-type processing-associated H-X9-DG protein
MRRRRAFTLVELLVVVGILALVAAVLLPALTAARERVRRVHCAANLRQLALAALAYADQNRGRMPGVGALPQQPHDWVYWQTSGPYDDPGAAALTAYLCRPLDPRVLRCPSDDREAHPGGAAAPAYPFSYTMNRFLGDRAGEPVRVTRIGRAAQKVLFVEEDVRTMEDGAWMEEIRGVVDGDAPPGGTPPSQRAPPLMCWEPLSARHELPRDGDAIPTELLWPGPTAGRRGAFLFRRGNAAFADGHADFIDRDYTLQPRNTLP